MKLEKWVRDVCDRAKAKQHLEDSLVELKRDWPPNAAAARAARQLAGQANAARGADILWLIGVDEKSGVVGAPNAETATWWRTIRGVFDDGAPILLQEHVFTVDDKAVVALLFGTEGAPFVIKVPKLDGSDIDREVPWRLATGAVSARRADLIRVLSRAVAAPDAELLRGSVRLSQSAVTSDPNVIIDLVMFLTPRDTSPVVLPAHKASILIQRDSGLDILCTKCRFTVGADETLARASASGLTLDGACRVTLRGLANAAPPSSHELRVTATLVPASDATATIVHAVLAMERQGAAAWTYGREDV